MNIDNSFELTRNSFVDSPRVIQHANISPAIFTVAVIPSRNSFIFAINTDILHGIDQEPTVY